MSRPMGMLSPADMELLRDTLEIYEAAQLGDLNRTAHELIEVCKRLGWQGWNGPPYSSDYLPWARQMVRGE